MRTTQQPGRDDRGSASAYLVLIFTALLLLAGLVLDGGQALAARGSAATIAAQAARSGADALSPASLRTGTTLTIDPTAARTAARRVLDTAGVDGDITVAATQVTVTVRVRRPSRILSAVGIDTVGGSATATASAIRGITTESGG